MANSRTGAVNVQVILRCRPLSKDEVANGTHQVITCNERAREVTVSQNVGGKQLGRSFHFDKVFDPDSGQEKLYRMAIKPIVEEVLEGFNCTIFAYGQTGTGKTYTMEGGPRSSGDGNGDGLSEEAGVIPRAIHQIFSILDANDAEYTVKCSFLELYNEETTDLLAVGDAVDQKLKMLEDNGRVVVQGLEEIIVKNKTDIYALLDRGSAKRRTAETLLNKQSSRSHSVFCVTVHMREVSAEGEEVIKTGKLYLVDLAGSENVNRSGAVDARAKEAGLINKSLLTLGRVITALVEKSPHVPYRDSKLTRLLRDSLGGRTKTCVIATIAPTVQCQEETLSTLDYAHRAKNIRNRPEVNQKISKTAHIKELNQEIDRLKAELFCTREKNGVYLPADQFQQREQCSAQLAARVETLEGDLELLREAHKSDMDTAAAELASVQEELRSTFEALQQSRVALEERDFLIATHERSEAALAGHATGLTSSLQSAAANIEALFIRLDASHGREAANTAAVEEIRDTAVTCLTDMQAAFSAAMAAQQQRSSQVAAALDSYLERKAADLTTLQGEMETLRERLDTIASTAGASVDQAALAGSSALSELHTQHTSYAQTAQEASLSPAAVEASRKLDAAYASLGAAFTAHQAQLDAYAAEQTAAGEAMLAAVRRATAAARGALGRTDTAAAAAGAVTATAMDAQAAALSRFEEDFAAGMAQEQAKLVEEVSTMLNSFAARKAAEVAAAVGGMRTTLAGGRSDVDAKFCALTQATSSATSALQSEETEAAEAATKALARREELQAIMAGTLQTCTTQGSELHGAAAADATAADGLLAGHAAAVEERVSGALTALSAAAVAAKRDCTSAAADAQVGRAGVLSRFHASHEADRESVSQTADSISKGSTVLQAFSGKHAAELTQLSDSIDGFASRQYTRDPQAGDPPVHAPPDVPPATWIDDMRTPPLEAVLGQFRAQKGGPPAAAAPADASAPPPEPAAASDAAAKEPAETPRSASGSEPDAFAGENVNPNRIVAAVSAALGEQPTARKGNKSRIPGARSRAGSRHASPRSRHASPMR